MSAELVLTIFHTKISNTGQKTAKTSQNILTCGNKVVNLPKGIGMFMRNIRNRDVFRNVTRVSL